MGRFAIPPLNNNVELAEAKNYVFFLQYKREVHAHDNTAQWFV